MVVFIVEMMGAVLVTAIAAAILIPAAYAERGYFAVGGEWLVLMLIAIAAYSAIHNYLFDRAERQKGGKNAGREDGRNKRAC